MPVLMLTIMRLNNSNDSMNIYNDQHYSATPDLLSTPQTRHLHIGSVWSENYSSVIDNLQEFGATRW